MRLIQTYEQYRRDAVAYLVSRGVCDMTYIRALLADGTLRVAYQEGVDFQQLLLTEPTSMPSPTASSDSLADQS